MKIACMLDSRGKVYENRIHDLENVFKNVKFEIFLNSTSKIDFYQYHCVYYLNYAIYKKKKIKHNNLIASITSHKSLDNKSTIDIIKCFNRVSVNNLLLYEVFKNYGVIYIPNGVDSNQFTITNRKYDPQNIIIGWVGNSDRATKNFNIVLQLSKYYKDIKFKILATSKSKEYKFTHREMVNFYHSIDYYLVASTTEGTPNPALEAASCGVPIITTHVGNMPQLIREGENGFFIDLPNFEYFIPVIDNIKDISTDKYNSMSKQISEDIRSNWQWTHRIKQYKELFGW